MLASFLTGSAILLGFVVLHILGVAQLAALMRRFFKDDAVVAKYWGVALAGWTVAIAVAFALVAQMEWASPVSTLAPFVLGSGVLVGLFVLIWNYTPNDD